MIEDLARIGLTILRPVALAFIATSKGPVDGFCVHVGPEDVREVVADVGVCMFWSISSAGTLPIRQKAGAASSTDETWHVSFRLTPFELMTTLPKPRLSNDSGPFLVTGFPGPPSVL